MAKSGRGERQPETSTQGEHGGNRGGRHTRETGGNPPGNDHQSRGADPKRGQSLEPPARG